MTHPNMLIRNPTDDFLTLLGEAITDDVEAWDFDADAGEFWATRHGKTFRLRLVTVTDGVPDREETLGNE